MATTITSIKASELPTVVTPPVSSSHVLVNTSNGLQRELLSDLSKQVYDQIKSQILQVAYPVGSIYMSVNSANPATLFGGTWEQIMDRFLLAAHDSGSYPAGSTGGEATHVLTVNEMPSHGHEMPPWMWAVSANWNTGTQYIANGANGNAIPYNSSKSRQTQVSVSVGGNAAHNNMPPYLAVYIWKRTA